MVLWKVSGAFRSPNRMQMVRSSPSRDLHAILLLSASLFCICQYSLFPSNAKKILVSTKAILSSIRQIGKNLRIFTLFRFRKSTQNWRVPSFWAQLWSAWPFLSLRSWTTSFARILPISSFSNSLVPGTAWKVANCTIFVLLSNFSLRWCGVVLPIISDVPRASNVLPKYRLH